MNSKMTTNSQLSTNELKKQNQKQTKQTARTEYQKWKSHVESYQRQGGAGRMGELSLIHI